MFSLVQEEMVPPGQMRLLKRSTVLPLCTLGFLRTQAGPELGAGWGGMCIFRERNSKQCFLGELSKIVWGRVRTIK